MKILYLITGLGGGGAEKVVVDLADRMYERGHDVKIAYLKDPIVVKPQNKSIEIVYLGLESLKDVKKAFNAYKKLIESFEPNVVHAHMVHANIFARIARKFYKVPKLICTAHSNNEGGKLRMCIYGLTHSLCDLMTNVSKSAAKRFEDIGAVPKGSIKVVYNGIDMSKFHKNADALELRSSLNITVDDLMFLAVGRLHEAKDYPNLLRSFSMLEKKELTSKKKYLVIVGDGELYPLLENLIEQYKITKNVILLGRRDDVSTLMSAANFFVLSSKFEGFGLVVAEAMACECFVVATDCGGVKEVMGGYGILVPAENSEALAEGLSDAVEMSPDLINKNNVAALDYVKYTFDLDKIVDQWLEIYVS